MLQRYDISMDVETNRLCIEEFSVLGRISRNSKEFESKEVDYSLVQKLTYDADTIRSAMDKGKEPLISAIRSNDFFPTHSYMDVIVEQIIKLFAKNSASCSEVFFDDHEQFVHDDE